MYMKGDGEIISESDSKSDNSILPLEDYSNIEKIEHAIFLEIC